MRVHNLLSLPHLFTKKKKTINCLLLVTCYEYLNIMRKKVMEKEVTE
jgi:hypothetical protein